MKISTKGRYALRVMLDLAKCDRNAYTPLKDISKRQNISEKYLEIIIKNMVHAGFVQGLRGKGGGYRLMRAPCEYTVAEILELAEGSLAPIACLETKENTCPRANNCETLPMWTEFYALIQQYFHGISLQELLDHGQNPSDFII